jgi:hypothetical protein
MAVVDDITCSAGGSLAIPVQSAEDLADPKILHLHKQVIALPRLRKGRPMLLKLKIRNAKS